MEDNNKIICDDEVITILFKNDNVLILHDTYQAKDFLSELVEDFDRRTI